MRYDPAMDHYVPVAWADAFALIGRELNAMEHPDQAEFYTSGRTSNEAAFLYHVEVMKLVLEAHEQALRDGKAPILNASFIAATHMASMHLRRICTARNGTISCTHRAWSSSRSSGRLVST